MSISASLPIFWLTIRQFTAGKATRVVGLFAATPVIFGLIYAINPEGSSGNGFLASTYLELLAPTVVPLATLILATGALGNEIADRTLPYLVLKPISRLRIVLEKFSGLVLVIGLAFAVGVITTWAIVTSASVDVGIRALVAMLAAVIAGVLAYGAIFLFISLIVPRALIAGIIYILLWESLLARFIPGIRILSVRHFTQSIFAGILSDPMVTIDEANRLSSSTIVIVAVTVISLLLATLRLRQMNLD